METPQTIHGVTVIPGKPWVGLGRLYNIVFPDNQQTSICVTHTANLEKAVKMAVERFKESKRENQSLSNQLG